jgi:hypothetical protein
MDEYSLVVGFGISDVNIRILLPGSYLINKMDLR